MSHKRSTAFERSVITFLLGGLNRFHCTNLTLSSDVDKLRYNKLSKKVTKDSSVPFENCKLHLIYPHYVCVSIYMQKSHKNSTHKRSTFRKSRICSTCVNNLIESEKQVIMTNSIMNLRESIHRHHLEPLH